MLIHFYRDLDYLDGYINIHKKDPLLKLWGHARIIVFLPYGRRLTW
jgi:hypothetical protein